MSKRRAQNKKSENKSKNQSGVLIKKRSKKSRQTNFEKACSKIHDEDKENANNNRKRITSERITMPLGFFSQGIKSKIVQKNIKTYTLNQESCNFLNEDLHALLQNAPETECKNHTEHQEENCSRRMVTRSQSSQKHFKTVSDYYMKLESECKYEDNSLQPQPVLEENKSMFREIDKCYSKLTAKQKHPVEQESSKTDTPVPSYMHKSKSKSYFCRNLEKQLSSVTLHSRKAQCLNRIKTVITNINDTLDGREMPHSPKEKPEMVTYENIPTASEQLIPKSNWSYETPNYKTLKQRILGIGSNKFDINECKPMFQLSSNGVRPKFFEPANYSFNKSVHHTDKNQLHSNLTFGYQKHIPFTGQADANEFLLQKSDNNLLDNIDDAFEDNKLFEGIETLQDDLLFSKNNNNSFKPLHQDLKTPDPEYFNLLPIKQPKLFNENLTSNFFETFSNQMATAPDSLNENILLNGRSTSCIKEDYSLEFNKCFKDDLVLDNCHNHPKYFEYQKGGNFNSNNKSNDVFIPVTTFYTKQTFNF